jgi:hypothetical protein
MRFSQLTTVSLLPSAFAALVDRDDCGAGFTLCVPAGATSLNTPQIGDAAFLSLFNNIVSSSLPSSGNSKRAIIDTRGSPGLCCNALLSCMLMNDLAIPFCYDRFTTNYKLPDGSVGTIIGGSYSSPKGDTANLETGDFSLANGTKGNLYAANPNSKPNTATLSMPTQYTATGVGSAIPMSSIGFAITLTYTTTLPGKTFVATTIAASTVPAYTKTNTIVQPTTIVTQVSNVPVTSVFDTTIYSETVVPASVVSESTISGTTISPQVFVVTTTSMGNSSASASATASATLKKSGAEMARKVGLNTLGLGFVVCAVACLF